MRFDYIHEFVVLAEQLNFTAAAEQLFITQPALSNHISTLEKDLGFKLIERSRGNASQLTRAGRVFLNYANKMMGLYRAAVEECSRIEQETTGSLVVQAPVDMHTGTMALLDLLRKFEAAYPLIDISRISNSSYGLTSDSNNGSVDVALTRTTFDGRYEIEPSDRLGYVPLSHERLFAWISAEHPLARKETLTADDLVKLEYPYMTPYHQANWKQLFACIERALGITLTTRSVFCKVREDFYLGEFDANDCVFLSDSLRSDLMFRYREDRVFMPVTPSLDIAHWLAYDSTKESPALDAFVAFAIEHRRDQDVEWV